MGHAPKLTIDRAFVERRNQLQHDVVAHARSIVRKVTEDPHRLTRYEKCECALCYGGSRIGGATVSFRPCGRCDKQLCAGNTAVDVLCLDCARDMGLCKHCGADLDYKNRRKIWQRLDIAKPAT